MSTRNTRQTRKAKPNAALYVGYVEDDETPEMIMKKFQMMEEMAAANVKNKKKKELTSADKAEASDSDEEDDKDKNNEALSEQQLAELFTNTSYYSLNSLQRNNDIMFTKQTVDEDGFVIGMDDPDYQQLMFEVDYNAADSDLINWMDTNEDDYIGEDEFFDDADDDASDDKEPTVRKARRGPSRGMAVKKNRFAGHGIGASSLRQGGGGKLAKKVIECHETNYLKVPNYPIPRSWLKPIAMFDGRRADEYVGYHYAEKDILSMAKHTDFFFENNAEKTYKAILMDPPFDMSESPVHIPNDDYECPGTVKLADFRKLPMAQIIPKNVGCMLFIWVPPEFTMQINDICEEWGFYLVEHATWIMRNLSWQIENRQSKLIGISKCNLLLYRRSPNGGKNSNRMELRHQRTSDSYFDFVRYHPETHRELKSDYHYKVIETLLPDTDKKAEGQSLFLWAPKNEMRDGWTCVADTKQLEMLAKHKPNTDIGDW